MWWYVVPYSRTTASTGMICRIACICPFGGVDEPNDEISQFANRAELEQDEVGYSCCTRQSSTHLSVLPDTNVLEGRLTVEFNFID